MRDEHDLYPMLSVEQALERVLAAFHPLEAERAPILETLGRVLMEDVHADMDIPPHANTAMDGYALLASDTVGASQQAPKRLRVIENLAAGYVAHGEVRPGTAIRIMTGAPIPDGADAVVRFEDTHQEGEWVDIRVPASIGENVRLAGEDVHQGELVLPRGTLIRPQEVGMLASLGCKEAYVVRRPRVAILSTGDELVEIDEPVGPGKIRNSNGYSNAAQVLRYGGVPIMLGIARDDIDDLTTRIRSGLARGADLLLTSGGVSVGDFDVVKNVLAAEGEITFWRVRMKPGKPLAFGRIEAEVDGTRRTMPVLGLPGNPVSVMVSFEIFCRPAILTMQGLAMQGLTHIHRPTIQAILMDEIPSKDNRRHYVRVHIEQRGGEYRAWLTGDQGSGILRSMVQANGIAVIPEEWTRASAGAQVQAMLLE